MSAELADAVRQCVDSGIHVALVDRPGDEPLPRLMAHPESVAADFESEMDLIAALRTCAGGATLEGRLDRRRTILCCTDSRKDACCARYGFATYKALAAAADPKRFNVVQATHIGGCRFAASLMVLPIRQRYARMSAGQVPAFLEALARNEIYLPAFKGRADQPEPFQVAELAAMQWAADQAFSPRHVRLLPAGLPDDGAANPAEGDELTLRAEIGTERLAIRLRARNFMVQGNCGIVAQGGGKDVLRWCLDDVKSTPNPETEQ